MTRTVTRTAPDRLPNPAHRTGQAASVPRPATGAAPLSRTDTAPLSLTGVGTHVDAGVEQVTGATASPSASPRTRTGRQADSGRGTPPGSTRAGRAVERRPVTEGAERPVPRGVGSVHEPARPVRATVVRPVTEAVGRPAGALAAVLNGGPSTPSGAFPSLAGLPVLYALPVLHALPATRLPALPGVPGAALPAVPEAPVLPALPAVVPQDPPQAGASQVERGVLEQRAGVVADAASSTGPAVAATREPTYLPGRLGARSGDEGVRRRPDGGVGPVSGPKAPPGGASGATGSQSALDNTAPRHAEVPAVTPGHRAPQRLARGTSSATSASGTGDRYRDIPVFPG
ncbi:hypothetical protein [Streptomyces sp. NPDC060188]|uniref:hypothetical protein n=1 Tax=Streptomyces sp. NPDC060188 TaxID=3347068 RepID=UPI003659A2A2